MNIAITLIRRELWEHRGIFVIVSAIVFALVVLAALGLGIAVGGGFTLAHPSGSADLRNVAQLGLGLGGIFFFVYAIAMIFYLSSALYSDRQDKSVFFWRSLPVSDTTTVLAKVGAAALLGPLVVWITTIAAHLITLFALACMASARGAAGFSVFSSPLALFGTWGVFAYALLVQALWWLPYFGYLLFVSAASRRVALLWAVLPPVIVGLLELIIFHTTHFFGFITAHLGFSPVFGFSSEFPNNGFMLQLSPNLTHAPTLAGMGAWVTHFFTLPSMWIGVGIGLALLALAVAARRYSATS